MIRYHTSFVKAILLGTILLCAASGSLHAQVTSNALRRVLLIRVGESFGTGFTIDLDGRQYLITARHVVATLKSGDTIQYFRYDNWLPLNVKVLRYDSTKDIDIAVPVPTNQLTVSLDLQPTSKGVRFGQDVYFLGFPFGILTSGGQANAGFPIPYIAKGAYSAQVSEQGINRIVIDGMTNHGLSGAPVVYRDMNQLQAWVFRVAGVAVAFKSDAARVLRRLAEIKPEELKQDDRDKGNFVLQDGHLYRAEDAGESVNLNTGIVVVYDIQHAIDLIHENPSVLGPIVSGSFAP